MEEKRYKTQEKAGYYEVVNPNSPVLGMGSLKLKEVEGLAFKNLSGTDALLPYEDWRLKPEVRAEDLAERLSIDDIAGLMLWSPHQMVPFHPNGPFVGHYNGGDFVGDETDPAALTDEQIRFVKLEKLRNVLLCLTDSADICAKWNNRLQAMAEDSEWGIPVCISSDPRHAAGKKNAEFAGEGKEVSRWPEGLGMAATFDPELVKEFAKTVAKEYRALGISLALGPQIDLATDPRWMRYEDTFGGSCDMVTAMARAYCDGLQTTEGTADGWGKDSVAAMVKHWPGGGTGEAGRDAHYNYGKFAVFPGNRLKEHMKPFVEGAFKLDGPTGKAASVMPYYTISWDQDQKYGENVGNSYSKYMIDDLLRKSQGYDGIVCTDWGITGDPSPAIDAFPNRCHGVEHLSEAEQHFRIIENGVDMFGGNDAKQPIMDAYAMGCEKYGEDAMMARMRLSAKRILTMMFRLGLFENPYLDPDASKATLGAPEFVKAGLDAQRRSVVLLKNKGDILPLKRGCKIYVPDRHMDAHINFFRKPVPACDIVPVSDADADGYFRLVSDPKDADAAVVFVESPLSDCYSQADVDAGGNGYLPISLQYRPYTADTAREHSIAKGDFREKDCDRGYRGKTNTVRNESDLDAILNARKVMGDKPVIVCMQLHNPAVVSEFEREADGILAHFGVEAKVLMEILSGKSNPSGRLPLIMPSSMETVEQHCEDVFDDIESYEDECGNCYTFGFGLTYKEK